MGAGADGQTGPVLLLLTEVRYLLQELLRVDHKAVAQDAELSRIEHPGGQEVKDHLLAVRDHRVPRVRAALVADEDVHVPTQEVDDLSLTLIAPLSADEQIHVVLHNYLALPPQNVRTRGLAGGRPSPSCPRRGHPALFTSFASPSRTTAKRFLTSAAAR